MYETTSISNHPDFYDITNNPFAVLAGENTMELKEGLFVPNAAQYGIEFDSESYVDADEAFNSTDFPDDGSFSISLWCTITAAALASDTQPELVWAHNSAGGAARKGFMLRYTGYETDDFNFLYTDSEGGGDDQSINSDNSNISADTWTHVVCSYDSAANKLRLWVNGVKKEETPSGEGFSTLENFRIAGRPSAATTGPTGWKGKIDEVNLYNVALTDAEVAAMRNVGGNARYGLPTDRGVKGIWHLDEGAGGNGTTIVDATGGNNGTWTDSLGTASWVTGIVPGVGSVTDMTILSAIDGFRQSEEGILQVGGSSGRVVLRGNVGVPAYVEATIDAGAISVPGNSSRITVKAESSTTDNLDTINNGFDGQLIILRPFSTHTITARDGEGNIICGTDFAMDDVADRIVLEYEGSNWYCIARESND